VEDLPTESLQDPMFFRSNGRDPGRDGCRVPLPWAGDEPPFGFSPAGATAEPWLPQPSSWRELTAERQAGLEGSMLLLYRQALRIRRTEPELQDGSLRWLNAPPGVLAFARGDGFLCVLNLSDSAVELPGHAALLVASDSLEDGRLPSDTAAWLRVFP
jgi:alpha-glucosidase